MLPAAAGVGVGVGVAAGVGVGSGAGVGVGGGGGGGRAAVAAIEQFPSRGTESDVPTKPFEQTTQFSEVSSRGAQTTNLVPVASD